MSTPRLLRANLTDLFGAGALPVMEEMFRGGLERHPMRRDSIFKTVKTERDIWQSSEIHDMPLFEQMSEAQDYSMNAPKQGANKTLVPVKYGLGFSISEEAVEDGKFDFIADAMKKMAESAAESQEISAMNILNNGFGSSGLSADGQYVFDTDHTLPSGGTFSNLLTAADISATSIEAALLAMEVNFIGDSGIIKNYKPSVLVCHPSFKRSAKELLGSDLKVNNVASDNGPTNAYNSFKEEGVSVISSPHITDADSWFLLCKPDDTGLRIISRKGIETKSESIFINDSLMYKSRYREVVGVTHPYGILGNRGA
jgi:phage major head subunit gpT-like protein